MKILSWNINGVRAWLKNSGDKHLRSLKPDVVFFQEVKAHHQDIPELLALKEFSYKEHAIAQKKGYSGVSFYSKMAPTKYIEGIGQTKFDDEGRTQILVFETCILFNCYFPNGRRDHSRVEFKLEYYELIRKKALSLEKKYKVPSFILGDWNTAYEEIDLANPKGNKKTTGFLPKERESLGEFFSKGFTDLYRSKNPNRKDIYSWWTYRFNCRERNIGWRIDLALGGPLLSKVDIQTRVKYHPKALGSDHCPLSLEILP